MKQLSRILVIVFVFALVVAGSVAAQSVTGPAEGEAQTLNASGATFPLNLYNAWNADYRTLTGVAVNYAGGGSGRGQRDIISGVVDFAGTDAFLSDGQIASAACGPLVHVPATLGGIAVIYNIPEIAGGTPLNLNGNTIAKIYLGEITRWNDPILVADNPQLANVNQAIIPTFRADSSGTTLNFTTFLASENQKWLQDRRVGTAPNWVLGQSAQGNPGVANLVKSSPYAMGYVEVSFATGIDIAAIKNPRGGFILPTSEAVSLAAQGVDLPADTRIVLIYRSAEPAAYPISTFSWLVTCRNQADAAKALAVTRYLWWATHEGQSYSANLGYAPLPAAAVALAENIILSINNPDGTQALPTSIASR